MTRDPIERIADAAERIAAALDALARSSQDSEPRPRLSIARSPTDHSELGAVNLSDDGRLNAILQNTGDIGTTLIEPTVEIGSVTARGTIVVQGGTTQPSGTIPASKNGPGVALVFQLEPSAVILLDDRPLILRVPHRPGRYPGTTVLEVEMSPMGYVGGRLGWRLTDSREVPHRDAHA
jgi:hypothetical protein